MLTPQCSATKIEGRLTALMRSNAFPHRLGEPSQPQWTQAKLYEKLRKEKPAEVEYHALARSNGIAGFLQHRVRFRKVSLADDCSATAHRPYAGLQ